MSAAAAWARLRASPVFPWAVLFVVVNLLVTQLSNENAKSRIAGLRAITEGHTLNINNYKAWTMDWSLAPNGNYYSNKAPGGVMLGLPVFWATDVVAGALYRGPLDSQGRRPEPGYLQLTLLVLIMQVLPFAWLVILAAERIRGRPAQHFFALAAFFGNTAAVYMNSYFGHGLAAWLFLGFTLAWLDRRYALAAACFGFTMLTDYMGVALIPAYVLCTLWRERSWRPAVPSVLGGIPAGVIWVTYHAAAFGSPFAIATKFNNPSLLEKVADQSSVASGFSFLPKPEFLYELLFGTSRGILFTQPWLLVALAAVPGFIWRRRASAEGCLAAMLAIGMIGLLWINAGYGVWQGGWCAGPRYLSLVFPACALLAAWELGGSAILRACLWGTLAVALVFRVLIFPHSTLAPVAPLWSYYLGQYSNGHVGTTVLRLALLTAATAATLFWLVLRTRRDASGKAAHAGFSH